MIFLSGPAGAILNAKVLQLSFFLQQISLWQINAFIAFENCIYCGACVAFELNQPALHVAPLALPMRK